MRKLAIAFLMLIAAVTLQAQTTSTQSYTITINAACQLTFTSGAPPGGTADGKTAYGPFTFTASAPNCTLPLIWSATGLPTGLTLNSGTGVLSGTLPVADCTTGSCPVTFTVTVTTSVKTQGSKNLDIKMNMDTDTIVDGAISDGTLPKSFTVDASVYRNIDGSCWKNTGDYILSPTCRHVNIK